MRFIISSFAFIFMLSCSSPTSDTPSETDENAGRNKEALLFTETFEAGGLNEIWGVEQCCSHSIQVVDSQARAGSFSLRAELRFDDPAVPEGGRRAELRHGTVPPTSERWYGFSVFLPEDFQTDPTPELLAQWHGRPDFTLGEPWRSPPLHLATQNGRWIIARKWDAKRLSVQGEYEGREEIDAGAYQLGVWTDWVVHVRWTWEEDGFLEIWKNGDKVLERNGPNAFNDQYGPYFKTGVYKSPYETMPDLTTSTVRIAFIDEVRIGNEHATLADVQPGTPAE